MNPSHLPNYPQTMSFMPDASSFAPVAAAAEVPAAVVATAAELSQQYPASAAAVATAAELSQQYPLAVHAPQSRQAGLTEAEAEAVANAEGLTLQRSKQSKTGYRCVFLNTKPSKTPRSAPIYEVRVKGKFLHSTTSLGDAALFYARHESEWRNMQSRPKRPKPPSEDGGESGGGGGRAKRQKLSAEAAEAAPSGFDLFLAAAMADGAIQPDPTVAAVVATEAVEAAASGVGVPAEMVAAESPAQPAVEATAEATLPVTVASIAPASAEARWAALDEPERSAYEARAAAQRAQMAAANRSALDGPPTLRVAVPDGVLPGSRLCVENSGRVHSGVVPSWAAAGSEIDLPVAKRRPSKGRPSKDPTKVSEGPYFYRVNDQNILEPVDEQPPVATATVAALLPPGGVLGTGGAAPASDLAPLPVAFAEPYPQEDGALERASLAGAADATAAPADGAVQADMRLDPLALLDGADTYGDDGAAAAAAAAAAVDPSRADAAAFAAQSVFGVVNRAYDAAAARTANMLDGQVLVQTEPAVPAVAAAAAPAPPAPEMRIVPAKRPAPPPMPRSAPLGPPSPEELQEIEARVRREAAEEGLTLVRAAGKNPSGYNCVYLVAPRASKAEGKAKEAEAVAAAVPAAEGTDGVMLPSRLVAEATGHEPGTSTAPHPTAPLSTSTAIILPPPPPVRRGGFYEVRTKGSKKRRGAFLGSFRTAIEGALAYARYLGADEAAKQARATDAALELAGTPRVLLGLAHGDGSSVAASLTLQRGMATVAGMTEEQAIAAADAEGLTLVRADNCETGWRGVQRNGGSKSKPFIAKAPSDNGTGSIYLGSFTTAAEAALAWARSMGPERSRRAGEISGNGRPARIGDIVAAANVADVSGAAAASLAAASQLQEHLRAGVALGALAGARGHNRSLIAASQASFLLAAQRGGAGIPPLQPAPG